MICGLACMAAGHPSPTTGCCSRLEPSWRSRSRRSRRPVWLESPASAVGTFRIAERDPEPAGHETAWTNRSAVEWRSPAGSTGYKPAIDQVRAAVPGRLTETTPLLAAPIPQEVWRWAGMPTTSNHLRCAPKPRVRRCPIACGRPRQSGPPSSLQTPRRCLPRSRPYQ